MGKHYRAALKDSKKFILLQGEGHLNLPIQRLSDISGSGIGLYFLFVKYLAFTYFIMTLLSIVQLVVLFTDKGYEQNGQLSIFDYETQMAKLTIGNLLLDQNNSNFDKLDLIMGIDMLNIIIFVFFYLWFINISLKKNNNIQPLPSKYALELHGFPSTLINKEEILDFFKKFRKNDMTQWQVYDCYLARNYKNTLFYHQEIIDIFSKKLDQEQKNNEREEKGLKPSWLSQKFPQLFDPITKLNKQLIETKQRIRKKLQKIFDNKGSMSHDQYSSIKAYVIFELQSDKQDAYKLLNKYQGRFKKVPQDLLLLNKYKLKVNDKIDEPSGIRWENIEVKQSQRNLKEVLVNFLLMLFLIICLSLIILVNLFKPNVQQTMCTQEQWSNNVTWYVFIPEVHNDQCSEALSKCLQGLFVNFLIGFFVFSINTMLKTIIKLFSKFMRFTSISQELQAQTIQIFFAQFINTGVLVSLLQFDFNGFKLPQLIINTVQKFKEIDNNTVTYVSDFKRDFYSAVGGKIVLTTSILIITPIIFVLIGVPFLKFTKRTIAKTKTGKLQIKKALIPPEFELDIGYATTLNTIFITLFYSSGIPILIPIGFLALFSQYWSFKYRLLKYNKKPPQIDTSLNKKIIYLLPLAVIFHQIIGYFVYSQEQIFKYNNSGYLNQIVANFMNNTLGFKNLDSYLFQRINYNQFYNIFSLSIILLVLFISRFHKMFVKYNINCCNSQDMESNKTKRLNLRSYSQNLEYLQKYNLASYNIRENPRYELLIKAIDDQSTQDINQEFNMEQLKLEEQKMKQLVEEQKLKIKLREKQEMLQLKKQNQQLMKEQNKIEEKNKQENQNDIENNENIDNDDDEEDDEEEEEDDDDDDDDDDSNSDSQSSKKNKDDDNNNKEQFNSTNNLDNNLTQINNQSNQKLINEEFYETTFIKKQEFENSHKKRRGNRQSQMKITPQAELQINCFSNKLQNQNTNIQDDAFSESQETSSINNDINIHFFNVEQNQQTKQNNQINNQQNRRISQISDFSDISSKQSIKSQKLQQKESKPKINQISIEKNIQQETIQNQVNQNQIKSNKSQNNTDECEVIND